MRRGITQIVSSPRACIFLLVIYSGPQMGVLWGKKEKGSGERNTSRAGHSGIMATWKPLPHEHERDELNLIKCRI